VVKDQVAPVAQERLVKTRFLILDEVAGCPVIAATSSLGTGWRSITDRGALQRGPGSARDSSAASLSCCPENGQTTQNVGKARALRRARAIIVPCGFTPGESGNMLASGDRYPHWRAVGCYPALAGTSNGPDIPN
jgi:hypothetical protein